jgi:nucleoid DNA-binding protein
MAKRGLYMTKKDMAKAMADEMGLTHAHATEVIQRVLDGITETLCEDGRLELRNFGVFEVRERKPRTARNPRTGETVQVPAKRVVSFKPGRLMAERVGRLSKVRTVAATPGSVST